MLSDGRVFATLAVKDRESGKKFYGETLGLKKTDENEGGIEYESGGGKLFVYTAPTAGTGKATCAFWAVDDIEATVADLVGKGVKFEHYIMPGVTLNGDIHGAGPMRVAWFKDPDGNVLGIGTQPES